MKNICWVDLGIMGLYLQNSPISSESWQDHGLGLLRTIMHADGIFTDVETVKNYTHINELMPILARYDILIMNVRSYNFYEAKEIAEKFKDLQKNGMVIVGGMHTIVNIEEMKSVQAFDRICVGPGEGIISELVSNPEKYPRVVPGIAAASMDDWPEIDRNLWPRPRRTDNYPHPAEPTVGGWNRGPIATVITSKVCPWRCSFCNEASYIENIQRKSVDRVIQEINNIDARFGPIGSVVIHDSMFFQHPAWLEEWCEKYPKYARKIWPYWAAARADTVRKWPELFSRLVLQTNWNIVSIGLESGSDRTLLTLNKECTVQDNVFAIELINQLGDTMEAAGRRPVKLFSNVMFGVPGETRQDILETMNMVFTVRRNLVSPSLYAPYPGGALGYQLIAEGKSLLDENSRNRNPNADKTTNIDYQFIRECWAGLHNEEVLRHKDAWLAKSLDASGGIAKLEKFRSAQNIFVFKMKNGKSKISWGANREQAVEILKIRLTEDELSEIDLEQADKIKQQQLPSIVPDLG